MLKRFLTLWAANNDAPIATSSRRSDVSALKHLTGAAILTLIELDRCSATEGPTSHRISTLGALYNKGLAELTDAHGGYVITAHGRQVVAALRALVGVR